MKTRIILGDIHGHFDNVTKIIDNENPNQVIILGDYFDSFNLSSDDIINGFKDFINYKHECENHGMIFNLIIGNHDFHYFFDLNGNGEHYSGYRKEYEFTAKKLLNELISNKELQYVYIDEINKTLYSHAGITNTWLEDHNVTLQFIDECPDNYYRFTYKGNGDMFGNTCFASPIWVRPEALEIDLFVDENNTTWTQIVGHTHTHKPIIKNNLFVIDCLPFYYIKETFDDNWKLVNRTVIKHLNEDKRYIQ